MSELAIKNAGAPAISTMDDLARVAKLFADSGYFKDSKDAAQAGIRILAGLECGFGAFASMAGVHIIQGKPTLSANLMANAVKRSGRYNYRVTNHDDQGCTIEFFERWDGKWQGVGESSFTLEDAKKANLLNNPTWKNYPRNMCFARAMSNGVRWYCPDALGINAYTPEELGANVNEDGEIIEVVAQSSASQTKPETNAHEVEAEFPEDPPWAEEMITARQTQALAILLTNAGFKTDEQGKSEGRSFVAFVAGYEGELKSVKDLTKQQAKDVLDALGTGENGNYRSDDSKVQQAIDAWAVAQDEQRTQDVA